MNFPIIGWLFSTVLLFFYSFTQIDLGLTLTRASWWQGIQRSFQQIGYFQRPLSTGLYLLILFLLFTFYFLILKQIKNGRLNGKQIWKLIIITVGILWLSYNAFSYDLFNYIFDARILTYYHQNPYQYKALDFPNDPMLGFMHWTHRTYPYAPIWLLFTVPLSFLSFQKLIISLILFKGLAIGGYLLACLFMYRLLNKNLSRLAFFAFNPLVIIESLVSAHHDILMMGLVLGAFWYLKEKKYKAGWLMFILSAGIKFVTGLLTPLYLLVNYAIVKKRPVNWPLVWKVALGLMIGAFFYATKRTDMQPWYFLFGLPFVILIDSKWLDRLAVGLSIGLLLTYTPFLYLGNWNPPVPAINLGLVIVFTFLGLIVRKK